MTSKGVMARALKAGEAAVQLDELKSIIEDMLGKLVTLVPAATAANPVKLA